MTVPMAEPDVSQPLPELGENDRSATGFLPPAEFEVMADLFFADPQRAVRGWETAADAQHRIVCAVERLMTQDTTAGDTAIVSHGAVGTLLFCHWSGLAISRHWDQPPNCGGNYFVFERESRRVLHGWRAIDELTV